MRGFSKELMFVKIYVINNICFDIGWIILRRFCIRNGFEKISMIRSKMLIDFIDFKNFFCLVFKIVLDIVEFDVFKWCFLKMIIVE